MHGSLSLIESNSSFNMHAFLEKIEETPLTGYFFIHAFLQLIKLFVLVIAGLYTLNKFGKLQGK